MESIPKIARERLKAGPLPGAHPDADVLTAFVEATLAQEERQGLLAHLSLCADCREVLALSLPQAEELHPVLQPTRGGWLQWKVLRMGGALAAVAVVASGMLLMRPAQKPEPEVNQHRALVVKTGPVDLASSNEVSKQQAAVPQSVNGRLATATPAEAKSLEARKDRAAAPASAMQPPAAIRLSRGMAYSAALASTNAQVVNPGGNLGLYDKDKSAAEPQPAAPPPRPSLQAESLIADAVELSQAPAVQPNAGVMMDAMNTVPAAPSTDAAFIFRPMPRTAVTGSRRGFMVATPSNTLVSGPIRAKNFDVAKENSHGYLDREADAEDVRISADGTHLERLIPREVPGANSFTSQLAKGWVDLKTRPGVTLRNFDIVGREIWLCGTSGSLQHSMDNGQNFTEVRGPWPSDADLIRVKFHDPKHGEVITSRGETWSTVNGGLTWSSAN